MNYIQSIPKGPSPQTLPLPQERTRVNHWFPIYTLKWRYRRGYNVFEPCSDLSAGQHFNLCFALHSVQIDIRRSLYDLFGSMNCFPEYMQYLLLLFYCIMNMWFVSRIVARNEKTERRVRFPFIFDTFIFVQIPLRKMSISTPPTHTLLRLCFK